MSTGLVSHCVKLRAKFNYEVIDLLVYLHFDPHLWLLRYGPPVKEHWTEVAVKDYFPRVARS